MMKICEKCKKKFPNHLMPMPMFTSLGTYQVCAICALEIRNELHGLNDKEFVGEMANKLLNQTKEYLTKTSP